MNGEVPVYFEAAAAITTLVLLGQVLELRARSRTSARDSLAAASYLRERRAWSAPTAPKLTSPSSTSPGDILRVRPGEKVPVDGIVTRRIELRRRIADHRRTDPR